MSCLASIFKQVFVLLSLASLLPVLAGMMGFGFDLWKHFRNPKAASIPINYDGLWVALTFVGVCILSFGIVTLCSILENKRHCDSSLRDAMRLDQ